MKTWLFASVVSLASIAASVPTAMATGVCLPSAGKYTGFGMETATNGHGQTYYKPGVKMTLVNYTSGMGSQITVSDDWHFPTKTVPREWSGNPSDYRTFYQGPNIWIYWVRVGWSNPNCGKLNVDMSLYDPSSPLSVQISGPLTLSHSFDPDDDGRHHFMHHRHHFHRHHRHHLHRHHRPSR